MKVYAILNNYQLGSYAHRCLSQHIVEETRIDSKHTRVVWDNMGASDIQLLARALGGSWKIKEVEE